MFKRINLQFLISYLGLFPFLIILLDKFFLKYFDTNILKDFSFFYSLIIFVFIGAINWNLKKNIAPVFVIVGFLPSFLSIFIIIFFIYSYEVIYYLMIFFIIQLIFDNFIYKDKKERIIYYQLRIPLTFLILLSLTFIRL